MSMERKSFARTFLRNRYEMELRHRGPVGVTVEASSVDSESSYLRYTGSRDISLSGASVVLAVEIHRNSTITTTEDDFKAYLIPLKNGIGLFGVIMPSS